MPKVTYVAVDGAQSVVDGQLGESVMSAATRNGVPGIIGECGGNASCATCHVWVRDEFCEKAGAIGELEEDLLDMGVSERRVGSRLACQITLTEDLDGLTVDVPDVQP